MHTTLLIFRKDLRRFYPEILITLAILAFFVSFYPYTWRPHDEIPFNLLGLSVAHDILGALPTFFLALLPITWIILITRVVQDESLVGDRQYWVTRPIPWPRLLAAKLLFLALFLELPYLLALALLLHAAGFPILPYLPRLVLLVVFTFSIFVLPLFALATLTKNFFRLFLTLLGLLALIAAAATTSNAFDTPSLFIPYTDLLSASLFIPTCVIVILVQYSSRTVWLARGLTALMTLLTVVVAVNPLEASMLERLYYPLVTGQALPVQIAIPPDDPSRTISLSGADEKHPTITIPLTIADVPYGFQISPEDARVDLQAANGASLTGTWQAIYNRTYLVSTRYATVQLRVDRAFIAQVRAHPVTLRLSLALAEWEDGTPSRLRVPAAGPMPIPGLGLCVLDPNPSLIPGLTCRFPLHEAPAFRLAAPWTTQPCTATTSSERSTAELVAYPGTADPTPIDVSLTSVWVKSISFALRGSVDQALDDIPPITLCPGATLTLTPLHLVRRARMQITLPNFTLPTPAPAVPPASNP